MQVRPVLRPRRLVAAGLSALVALSGLGLASAPTASAAPVNLTGGYIEWGVKSGFRSYVTGPIALGTITVASSISGIAPVNRAAAVNVPVRTQSDQTVLGTDVYRFGVLPQGTNDSATKTASVASGGVVRFQGHAGQLDITVDHVRVSVSGSTGTIVADVTSKPLPSGANPTPVPVLFDDVALGSLDLTAVTPTTAGGYTTYANIPATLTAAGSPAFAGFYAAGDALDPVTLVLRDTAAATAPVTGQSIATGSLRWTLSRQIWGQTSLNQCLVGLDGATVQGTPSDGSFADPANGISFPIVGGKLATSTGATQVDLDGAVVLGNRAQGNYRIKLADPALTIDGAGNGVLTADVSYSLPPGGAPPATCDLTGRTFVAGGDDVVVATFTGTLAQGAEVTGTFTPHFAENVYSADPRFIAALDPSLRGHFSVSNGNPNTSGLPAVDASHRKVLQPIRVGFTLVPPVATTLDLTPATAAKQKGQQACVVAKVTSDLGTAMAGQGVTFAVTGANPGSGTGTTDAAGNAQHCFTGTAVGTSTITATSGNLSDTAAVTWTAPPPANPLAALLASLAAAVAALLAALGG